MQREIIKDIQFLNQVCETAKKEDSVIGIDLLDTLLVNQAHCIGLAANMIGIQKRIVVVLDEQKPILLYNPVILKTYGNYYEAEEGCLSLSGTRKTMRYEKIKVQYEDVNWKRRIKSFQGLTAQALQHEIDHCNGKII